MSDGTQPRGRGQKRRDVLKLVGAGAASTAAFAGTASAHHVDCIFFCGCGRMVAYGGLPKYYYVLVAKEGGGPGKPDLNSPKVHGNENDDVEFVQRGRGKILALVNDHELKTDGVVEVWYNPNQCAQNVFDEYGGIIETLDAHFDYDRDAYESPVEGQKGHCHPPREHEHDHC